MDKQRYRIISICLLAIFCAYQIGITMFTHVHVVNGVALVHSHPSNNRHTHTEGQILTLAQLSTFVGLENPLQVLEKVDFPLLRKLDISHSITFSIAGFLLHIHLRAPPVSCS